MKWGYSEARVPITNQFQVVMYLQAAINISFHVVLQVVLTFVFKFLFTSWYTLSLCCHLFASCYTLYLQAVAMYFKFMYQLLLHVVFTSCYNVLQVHVSTRSEITFGNDVIHHNSTTKSGSKIISHTTPDISFGLFSLALSCSWEMLQNCVLITYQFY